MGRKYIKDLRRGETVSDVFLVETVNFKQARNGSNFLQLVLRDFTGSVKAMRWESSQDEYRQIERNPFLLASGRVEEYQGNKQIVLDEISSLSASDASVNPEEFLPRSKHAIPEMASELRAIVDELPNDQVRLLVTEVLDRPGVWDRFQQAPAGKAMHHAYIGGLLEHVLSMAKLAERVLEHYSWIDRSMLLAGVVLHDIGKIEELTYDTGFGYSDEGQLIGHIVIASSWVDEAAQKLGDQVEPTTVRELKHLILSHHGKMEYGSPRIPATAEALALHYLDNLDAKLAGYLDALQATEPSKSVDRWGDYSVMFGTRLYFPGRLDEAMKAPPESTPGGPRSAPKDPGSLF